MSQVSEPTSRRVERLLRWYPVSWRSRYGDEFAALLTDDVAERPRSLRRTVDVAASGVVARLNMSGLTARTLDPGDQVRASLASLGCALAAFLVLGVAMWAQLAIGWQWSRPDTTGTSVGMVAMSATMLVFGILVVLAAVPIASEVIGRFVRRESRGLVRPTVLVLAGAVVLTTGARHFGNGWPGTGGHPWAHQGLVPGGVAAFAWASTLSVTSYWAHPGALLSFPAQELTWMAVSPVAMACLVVGSVKTVRRLDLPPRALAFERWLANLAVLAMTAFLIGSIFWLVDGGPGPRNLFHAGAIDLVGLVVMAGALIVSHQAVFRARNADLTAVGR